MIGSEASFRPDGSCRLTGETDIVWTSVPQWAIAWFAEQRAHEYGDACTFVAAACDAAVPGLVDALVVLADTAASEVELAWVGAGPLEHLVSHSGNSPEVLADVDRAAHSASRSRTPGSAVMCLHRSANGWPSSARTSSNIADCVCP